MYSSYIGIESEEYKLIIGQVRDRAWFVRLYGEIAKARGLSTVQVHKPCSISLYTLHVTEYLVLKIGYLWIVVQAFREGALRNPGTLSRAAILIVSFLSPILRRGGRGRAGGGQHLKERICSFRKAFIGDALRKARYTFTGSNSNNFSQFFLLS